MANSRKPSCADPADVVGQELHARLFPGARVVLGLSGGVDSAVLLHILSGLCRPLNFSLCAVYVNHGISPNAGSWGEFCKRLCTRWGVELRQLRVDLEPHRHLGLEGAARLARYGALAAIPADF